MDISIDGQIACVEREIKMRVRVYPRWVEQHKMTQAASDHQIAAMRAVLATLQRIKAEEKPVQAALI